MSKRKKIIWNDGDVFAMPLLNNKFSIGQTLGQSLKNTVRIALFDEIIDLNENINTENLCNIMNLISLVEVTREQLDYGVWKILGNKKISIPLNQLPNEKYRKLKWIGCIIYDAALAEDFINAFYALRPWDDWGNPNFLNEFLTNEKKKPKKLILVKSK